MCALLCQARRQLPTLATMHPSHANAPVGVGANLCPQSQTIRRAGISRLHFGQALDHDLRGGLLTSVPAALRAAREIASARATAHCGCVPIAEYDGLPHTGQLARLDG